MVVHTFPAEWTDTGEINFYLDDHLDGQLEVIRKKVKNDDEDYFIAIDGQEGSGKSLLAQQIAKRLDPTFDLSRMVFSGKEFQDAVLRAKPQQAIVFDEAFRGLSSRGALTEVNKLLVGLMMECRQKNLFVIIVMPSFFLLDKYVAIWRAKGLFHVYRPKSGQYKGRRGFWMFFNSEKKKLLYLWGRKTYSYDKPESSFTGRFLNQYTVPETEYRAKKAASLQSTSRLTKAEQYMDQRNAILWYLIRKRGMTTVELSRELETVGVDLAHNTISEHIVKKEEDLKKKGYIAEEKAFL